MQVDRAEAVARRAALRGYAIFDTAPEPEFDRITRLAQQLFATPIAVITLIDRDRLWFKSHPGLDFGQTPLEQMFWHPGLALDRPWCVPDLAAEPQYEAHPLVTGGPRVRFYAGAAVRSPGGVLLGTICVLDTQARPVPDLGPLADLADLVTQALEARRQARAQLCAGLIDQATAAPSFEAAVDTTLAGILAATGGTFSLIWRKLPGQDRLVPVGGHAAAPLQLGDYMAPLLAWPLSQADSMVGRVLATGVPVIVPDVGAEAATQLYPALRRMQGMGVLAKIAVPVDLGDQRHVLTLAVGPGHRPLGDLVQVLADLAPALRPLMRRHADQTEANLLRRVVEASHDQVVITEVQATGQRILYVNPAVERATGFAAAELVGRAADVLHGPDLTPDTLVQLRNGIKSGQPCTVTMSLGTKEGRGFWGEVTLSPLIEPGGWSGLWVAITRDITERRREAQRLAASEAAFRSLFQHNPIPMWIFDPRDLRFLQVNDAAVQSYGWSREAFLQMTVMDLRAEDDPDRHAPASHGALGGRVSGPWQHIDAYDNLRHVELVSHSFADPDQPRILVAVWDVTDQIEAEAERAEAETAREAAAEQLRTQTAQLRHAQNLAKLGTWYCTGETGEVHWSQELFRIVGIDATERKASEISVMGLVHSDDRARMGAAFVHTLQTGAPMALDIRGIRADGSIAHLRVGGTRRFRADGIPLIDGFCQDVSEQHAAELALLRSEKLRTMGQLTGGIAHDFNNLLTVISGNLELALQEMADGRPAQGLIDQARAATERGASLTQQLLSYAGRRPVQAAPLDLAQFLPGLVDLVGRTLGDSHPVSFDTGGLVDPVLADRAQLETALVNLLLNARDAMPGGGEIAVTLAREAVAARSDDLAPGAYGVVAVTDRGIGMSAEVRARAFEPFYTTKPAGQGTGLGLSMVAGFAQALGGAVVIDSAPGRGTTVRLYLPLSTRQAAPASAPLPPRVLVIADQAAMRRDLLGVCQTGGLETLGAEGAEGALRLMSGGTGSFDLVLADGIGAAALAPVIARLRPGVPVMLQHAGPAGSSLEPLRLVEDVPPQSAEALARLTEALANLRTLPE